VRLQTYIAESSLSRVWKQVEDNKRSFAVVSASRKSNSRETNEKNYIELIGIVREWGYGYIKLRGGYIETEGFVSEKSLFIPSISKEGAIELGKRFDQDSVLFKDGDEFIAIGTNKDTGVGKVLRTFFKGSGRNNINLTKEAVKDFFSSLLKGSHRGRKFAFNIQEKQDIGLWGRMGGRMPEWITIYETTDIHN
jgi:hypothetical protein